MLFSASCSSLNLENKKKIQFQLASKAIIHMNMLSIYGRLYLLYALIRLFK